MTFEQQLINEAFNKFYGLEFAIKKAISDNDHKQIKHLKNLLSEKTGIRSNNIDLNKII